MGKPIVVLGIFNADAAYRAARLPRLGETIMGAGFHLGPGGKGSNQAVAAGRAGGDVHMITRLGADDFGLMARGVWASAGVTPHVIEDAESHTGSAFIFLEEGTGQNAIIVCPGAAGRISVGDIQTNAALIQGAGVFLTQLEQPLDAAEEGLRVARAAGVTTILNPAPATDLTDAMLSLVDIITPNESEAEGLTGLPVTTRAEAEAAADALIARGVGAAIITLGEKGVLYRKGGKSIHVPARAPGPVKETTGAGDAFNGGLATALAEGQAIEQALRFGCAVAGISVTRPGAAASMPHRAEIDAFLAG
ncbi:ribokinase [Thioclava sp. FR2]|uniref:ribokinase n=1 Tax=Thioclava sp. FR2 TaxID=3445780 RepID=UPI003EBF96A3